MLPLLLAACESSTLTLDTRPTHDRVEHVGGSADTATDTATDTGHEPEPDPTRIFNLTTVHQVDLTISEDGLRSLSASPYTFVQADVTFDGVAYPTTGIRIKGRLGSYRTLDGKPAFKWGLKTFGQTAEIEGLDALNFNNMVQDCAKVKELAAYDTFRAGGIPAARVGYAWIRLNGADYGLYSVVEEYDDEFLKANFQDPSGNLYDGDYYLWPDQSYTLVDFSSASEQYFSEDEGADVAMADINAITTAVAATTGTADFDATVGALLNLEDHQKYWAVEAWIGQYDSYSYYSNNYRVYFDPDDGGRARLLPWDPDWAFGDTPLESTYGVVSTGCRTDTTCRQGWIDAIHALRQEVVDADVLGDVTTAEALINPYLRQDPRLEYPVDQAHNCQGALEAWITGRSDSLAAAGY